MANISIIRRIFFLLCSMIIFLDSTNTSLALNSNKAAYHNIPSFRSASEGQGRCEAIRIDYCKGVEYNQTILPNLLGHQKQDEAEAELEQYKHLMTSQCNPSLNIFLCTLFVPVCTDIRKPIPPCQPLCSEVQAACEPFMNKFSYSWPNIFKCSKFPVSGLCVGENKTQMTKDLNRNNNHKTQQHHYNKINHRVFRENSLKELLHSIFFDDSETVGLQCPPHSKVPWAFYKLHVGERVIANCGLPCQSFHTPAKRKLASQLVGCTSVVCLIATLFTLFSFLVDTDRFRLPEKCIVAMAGCYAAVCLAYLAGFIFGDQVACVAKGGMVQVQGTRQEYCSVVFMLAYYFGMAAQVWWVLLCASWLLSTGLRWAPETIQPQYLHLLAWGLPALKTIAVLAWGKVEGDSLVGICYVGLSNPRAFKIFVLAPLIIYLVLGLLLWLTAQVSLHRIKRNLLKEGSCTLKLEKTMLRIYIFAVIFCIHASSVIACHIYELTFHPWWVVSWYLQHSNSPSRQLDFLLNDLIYSPNHQNPSIYPNFQTNDQQPFIPPHLPSPLSTHHTLPHPDINISIFKHLMTLIFSIFIAIWMCSYKTLLTFKNKLHCCRGDGGDVLKMGGATNNNLIVNKHLQCTAAL